MHSVCSLKWILKTPVLIEQYLNFLDMMPVTKNLTLQKKILEIFRYFELEVNMDSIYR